MPTIVSVQPLLLDPGDWVKFNCLTSRAGKVNANTRISGVKQITIEKPRDRQNETIVGIVASIATAALTLIIAGLPMCLPSLHLVAYLPSRIEIGRSM